MAKQTKTWKATEKMVAKIVGGTRINGARGVQMQDVEHEIFSIEVKHGKTTIPKFVSDSYEQGKRNAPAGKIPLLVLHKHGSQEYMAVLPLHSLVGFLRDHCPDASEAVAELDSLALELTATEVAAN